MAHYQGMTLSQVQQYILGVVKSKKYKTNLESITLLLNEANTESKLLSGYIFELFTKVTETDIDNYTLPLDLSMIHDVFMQETGEDGAKALKPTTLKHILNTLADDAADDTVEP